MGFVEIAEAWGVPAWHCRVRVAGRWGDACGPGVKNGWVGVVAELEAVHAAPPAVRATECHRHHCCCCNEEPLVLWQQALLCRVCVCVCVCCVSAPL